MKVSVEDLNSVQKKLHVVLPIETVNKEFDNSFKKIQKDASIQGFRKGKAPMHLIQKFYKDQVLSEVGESLLNQNVIKASQEAKIVAMGFPGVENATSPKLGEEFTFTVIVDIPPVVEVGDLYKNISVEVPRYVFSEANMNRALAEKAEKHSITQPLPETEVGQDGLQASIEVTIRNVKNAPFDVIIGHNSMPSYMRDCLLNMKVGETKEVKFPADPTHVHGEHCNHGHNHADFEKGLVTLVKLSKIVPPAIDDTLADMCGYDSLEDLKNLLKQNQMDFIRIENARANENALLNYLFEKIPFEVPPTLVSRQIDNLIQTSPYFGKNVEQSLKNRQIRDSLKSNAISQLKSEFILMKIAQAEKIEATEAEVKEFYFKEIPTHTEKDFNKWWENHKDDGKARVAIKKTMEFLLKNANFTYVEKPYEKQL